MAKERKKSVTPKTTAPKRTSKNVVTTDDGVTTDDAVTTRDEVVMDDTVSTNGGVIVDADSDDERSSKIAKRAYARYEARGFIDGHDLEDWLAAEAEL